MVHIFTEADHSFSKSTTIMSSIHRRSSSMHTFFKNALVFHIRSVIQTSTNFNQRQLNSPFIKKKSLSLTINKKNDLLNSSNTLSAIPSSQNTYLFSDQNDISRRKCFMQSEYFGKGTSVPGPSSPTSSN